MLSKAKIDAKEIEIEFNDYKVRILTLKKKKKIFNSDSQLWKCIGCAEIEGVNGRNHDQFIYDEK